MDSSFEIYVRFLCLFLTIFVMKSPKKKKIEELGLGQAAAMSVSALIVLRSEQAVKRLA